MGLGQFENGFLAHLALIINPDLKQGYWGLGAENRPRIVFLNNKDNATKVEGYRLIEFLPNRDNKNEFYFFFGTPVELMSQCCQFFNQWLLSSKNNNQSLGNDHLANPKNKPREFLLKYIYLLKKQHLSIKQQMIKLITFIIPLDLLLYLLLISHKLLTKI